MSSEYLDTILVECDRSSATIKNDDDPSTWSNQQNNTLLLLPNDKVSVYSSYVNDIGSGQDAPIEFRGKRLKKTKTIQVINQTDQVEIVGDTLESINYVTYTTDELQDLVIDNKDNEANLVINFYKTMDLKNYIQLPRRFIESTETLSQSLIGDQRLWNFTDSVPMGRTHVETPYIDPASLVPGENAGFGYVPQDMRAFPSYTREPLDDLEYGDVLHWILKNDNSRYTIMKKLNNVNPNQPNLLWTAGTLSATRKDDFTHHAPYYAREPEYFQYKMVREHINLKTDVGFNSASSIAKKLSQDLQATKVNDREDFLHKRVQNTPDVWLDFVLNKTLESKTYKQIDVGSEELQKELYYKRALLNGIAADGSASASLAGMTTPLDGVQLEAYLDPDIGNTWRVTDANEVLSAYYYNAYRYVACKRPEIYEAGTELNDIFGLSILTDMLEINRFTQGMPLRMPYFETDDGTFDGVILEPRRPSAKLLQFKAFIESQELYPELWSQECVYKLLDLLHTNYYTIDLRPGGGGHYFNQRININNSRFAHMNTFVLQEDHGGVTGIVDYDFANSDVFEQDRNRHEDPLDAYSPVKNEYIKLGNSYYDYRGSHRERGAGGLAFNRDINNKSQSRPFFYHYDPDQKDEFYLEPVTLNDITNEKWSYGCFGLSGDYGFGPSNGVVIYPSALTYNKTTHENDHNVGLPFDYYHTFGGIGGVIKINEGTKAGFDRHWNAWANAFICLNSGKARYSYPDSRFIEGMTVFERSQIHAGTAGSGLATPTATIPIYHDQGAASDEGYTTNQLLTTTYNNKMYIGADSPKLDFDGSYFHFKDLHTSLNKGNLKMVDPIVNKDDFSEADGGKIVYKINPTQEYDQYSPVQYPYNRSSEYFLSGSTEPRMLTRMNFNAEALTIYDTTTGIFIADFGYNKDSWNEGLWARLGFSYEQFHSSTLSRLQRVNLNNINDLNIVTTNASIDCVDTKSWEQDQFGVTTFSGAPLVNQTIQVSIAAWAPPAGTDAKTIRWIPPIYQSTESVKIQAQNYPISMFNGYYSIRSDIVGDSSFVDGTGNTAMPIVSVISKQNPAGDFYITPESDIQFTITKPTRLSSVSVSITEPDGTPAPISQRSSVIFKIQRTRTLNTDLAREVFEKFAEKNKNKKSVYSPKM